MAGSGKILVIRGGAVGDFVLTLPVFGALRGQFPGARIEALAYPAVASLALAGGLVDGVRPIESRALAGFFAQRGELDPVLADYFGGFAIILTYLYDPDAVFQTNVGRFSKAQFIPGPHRPDEGVDLHATDVFLKPLERLAIFGADPEPHLDLPGPDRGPATIALHPGSGSEKKNWPEANWSELLRWVLENTRHRILLVGGEAEGDRLERLAGPLPAERVEVLKSRPLVEVAGRLAHCDPFVGHDSGISHLAAALGCRGLVLWGETRAPIWRPRSDRMTVLRDPRGLAALPVATVCARLRSLIPG